MTRYQQLIQDTLPQATPAQCEQIEEIMRQDIFHSTLDWQTRKQLQAAAREAWPILQMLEALPRCPECRSTALSEPDSEGLIDCCGCGIWFDPKHPNNAPGQHTETALAEAPK